VIGGAAVWFSGRSGRLVSEYPSIAAVVTAAGHGVGNHTWAHVSAPTLTDSRTVSEIDARGTAGHRLVTLSALAGAASPS
jgi:peptidoglycan/xylan/chitin deacetylase (PgdA/CDA1 family)